MKRIKQSSLLIIALLALCMTVPFQFARAQTTIKGGFHGTVSDSTGAVMPGASIVIKNLGTGVARTVTTDAAGVFNVTQVPPPITPSPSPRLASIRSSSLTFSCRWTRTARRTLC